MIKEMIQMLNRISRKVISVVLAMATLIFMVGCTKNVNAAVSNKSASTAQKTYTSSNGWSVKYDPSVITVCEDKNATSFIFTGNGTNDEKLTISYKQGGTPEKAADALAAGWNGIVKTTNQLFKSESYFPGTNDSWGYWRTLIANDPADISENAFAGEYNGGVLMFDMATRGNGDGWKALQNIMDSITYKDFAPQAMYQGIAGIYTMKGTELIEGKAVPVVYTVTLNNDHQGTIKLMGDEQYVMWGSHLLIQADNSYDYSVDGQTLTLNIDGNQLVFTK